MAKKYSNLLNVYHALWGELTKYYKHNMKNMSTTLEIPEGSKATIHGKVIDGVADAVNDCLCRECDCGYMG